MENDTASDEKEYLTHFEQYIISLLIAGFLYGGIYFSLNYLIKLVYPYFEFSEETIIMAKEIQELFLLDRNIKYLIPIIIYLFFFGLSMQSIYVMSDQKED